ncbi:mucin-3A-like [Lissotriton helveticus]
MTRPFREKKKGKKKGVMLHGAIKNNNIQKVKITVSIDVTVQMSIVYESVPGYDGVTIISLSSTSVTQVNRVLQKRDTFRRSRRGVQLQDLATNGTLGVSVDHSVQVNVTASHYQNEYTNAVKGVDAALLNRTYSSSDITERLKFAENNYTLQTTTLNLTGFCNARVPQGFGKYYYLVNSSSGLICASNCSGLNPHYYKCYNGECFISKPGPECFCQYSDYYWFSGERCQQAVSKIGVYVGVSLALALLLILIAILVFLAYRYRNRFATHSVTDVEKKWYEEGWESNAPEGFTVRSPQTVTWAGSESGGSSTSRDLFRPSLERVDTSAQMRIGRPQVTTI